jgi:RNA polymerase sigma-70 factor (ECF subfamily)
MSVYQGHTDAALVDLLKRSDQEAMTEIYRRYWKKLLAVSVNRLSDEQEAEECVQDVFLSLWNRRSNLVLRHELSTYLWVAVKYQVINRLDKRYSRSHLQTTELQDYHDIGVLSHEATIFEKELIARIEEAIGQLPEKCRMVYRKSREEGKTNKEIAAEMNVSEKTVEGHLTRALKDLRDHLGSYYPLFVVASILSSLTDKN